MELPGAETKVLLDFVKKIKPKRVVKEKMLMYEGF